MTQMEQKKILIAEDDELNRMLLGEILKKFGYAYKACANGREAVENFHRERFDVVFLDLHMPILDGKEAASKIRESAAQQGSVVWIVAISGDRMDQVSDPRLFDRVLQKPYLPQQVKELLEDLEGQVSEQEGRSLQTSFHEVLEKVGGDRDFLRSLLERFRSSSRENQAELQEALKLGDRKLAREVAHKWKGACSIFNASESMDLLAQLEDQIATGSDKKVQELIVLVETQTNLLYSKLSELLTING